MSPYRPYLTSAIVVLAGLCLLGGYLALWMLAGEGDPGVVVAADVPPEQQPWKTVTIAQLAAPAKYEPGADPAINGLIERHNARQDRLAIFKLVAQCTWNLDMPGDPRPMTIHFDRATASGDMTCGDDACRIHGTKVEISPGSAMNVDALYLLAFRKFNPKAFAPVGAAEDGMVVARSESETLRFDPKTGQLVGAEFKTPQGDVGVELSDSKVLPGGTDTPAPTVIRVKVPVDMFPFERTRGGTIELKIDGERSQIRGAP